MFGRRPPTTALPLGSYRGVDALDVWEHVLFQEYLAERWRPRAAEAERLDAERFEVEVELYGGDDDDASERWSDYDDEREADSNDEG